MYRHVITSIRTIKRGGDIVKIYDEIGKAMIGNPLNPPDPKLVTLLASIGIGPGKVPSAEANDTIKATLYTGKTEGQ